MCLILRFSLTVKMTTKDNICWVPSRKTVCLMEIVTAILISLTSEVVSEISPHYEPVTRNSVAYLQIIPKKVQTDISEFSNGRVRFSQWILQKPSYIGDPMDIVVIVWASEQETHAMRSCLYQEMQRMGKMVHNITSILHQNVTCFEFCNRSVDSATMVQRRLGGLCALSFYVNDAEDYGKVVTEPFMSQSIVAHFGYTEIVSQMTVRPINHVDSRVHTFVCNSIHLAYNKVGKLQQRFFSVVGSSTEVIVKSSRNGSASVILDFDILSFNATRIGMMNGSNVELLSLVFDEVSCRKLDDFGLNEETNEIICMDTTKDCVMTTKDILIKDKYRRRVNVSIPVVFDHSFGNYICETSCWLQKQNRKKLVHGCKQKKYFSIVLDCWRNENMIYRQLFKYCLNNITDIDDSCAKTVQEVTRKTKECYVNFDRFKEAIRKLIDEQGGEIKNWLLEVKMNITLREMSIAAKCGILISTIGGPLIVIIIYVIYMSVRKELNIHRDAKLFIAMLSKVQEMENNSNRTIKYDVFLSYSSKDRPWVQSTLLTFIERKGFKVCFDERDFPFGCSLPSTIEKSVFESRKAIAVLSPDYMKSGWCIELEYSLLLM